MTARTRLRNLCLGCLWVLSAAGPGAAQEPSAASGLTALRDAWTRAYEAGETDAMSDLYVEDAVRMPYDAPASRDRYAILAAYRAQFEQRRLHPRIDLTPERVRLLGEVAIERGTYDEILTSSDFSVQIHEVGKYVSIAERGADGRWRFAISIFNRDAPPARAVKGTGT